MHIVNLRSITEIDAGEHTLFLDMGLTGVPNGMIHDVSSEDGKGSIRNELLNGSIHTRLKI
jgi:hypothetical protein